MRMLRTRPFFPPKSGEKPYLVVFSRFGLWRDFLNDNIQATISVFRLIKNMSINPKSVEFHQYLLNHIRIVFYHNIKDNEINLCQEFWTIENTDSDLKVHALHYANELLVSLNIQKQYENDVWQKSNDVYPLSMRVQTTMNHISIFAFLCFYDNINVKENVFFQSAS